MGKPKKGQKAIGIAALEKTKKESTISRLRWLRNVISGNQALPDDFNTLTLASFCKFESNDFGFIRQSENNFKKHLGSESIVAEVKDILSTLRRKKRTPDKIIKPTITETIASKNREITELKNRIQSLTDDLISLRVAYNDIVRKLTEEPQKHEAIRKAIQEQHSRLGLREIGENNGKDS